MSKRILIADDEPTVVAMAKNKLEERGYTVETARNGKEAWEIVKTRPIDLLVTDVVMPVMDGVDLYKEMKKDPRFAYIPVIIITDSRIFRESFQTLGVEHFLPKPLDLEKLLYKVETVIANMALRRKNNQVLVLGTDDNVVVDMTKILEEQQLIVGKSTDPINFIHTCLILTPHVILIDVILKGDIKAVEVIRALKSFVRLSEAKIVLFTQFSPEETVDVKGVEQLRQIKNDCLAAGALKYIGRYTPTTFWDAIKEFLY